MLPVAASMAWLLPSCGTTTSVTDYADASYAGAPDRVVDAGGPAPVPPDGAARCPAGACNYQSGTGCSSELACRPQFTASSPDVAPGCEPAGDRRTGEACTEQSECAPGYYCAEGACRKQCCAGDWSACDSNESCIRQVQVHAGEQVVDSGLALCFPVNDCDPLDPGPCPTRPGTECKIVDARGAVACSPLSKAREGDACAPPTVCAAGLTCVLERCRKLCRAVVGETTGCSASDGACVHFPRDPVGVGECTPAF